MRVGCVLVAAGRGERLREAQPKALVEVGGRSVLAWALDTVRAAGIQDGDIAVVGPAQHLDEVRGQAGACLVVAGGHTRQDSVAAGLAAVPAAVQTVLVHDAARCLTPPGVFARVLAALALGHPAVVPAMPVVDTLRHLGGARMDRSSLVAVQTPQGFARSVLERAHATVAAWATDDATLVELAADVEVELVAGSDEAFKLTRPIDLLLAEAVLAARATR